MTHFGVGGGISFIWGLVIVKIQTTHNESVRYGYLDYIIF